MYGLVKSSEPLQPQEIVQVAPLVRVKVVKPTQVELKVRSQGTVMPSSESMTHGALYDLGPHIRFVFHAHTPVIWRRARELRIPTTDPQVPYGTPEMARETHRLFRSTALPDLQILSMGGHEDGIVVFGRTAEEAGQVMLRFLARAYEAECGEAGGLCDPSRR